MAAAVQAEIAAYVAAHAGELDEHGCWSVTASVGCGGDDGRRGGAGAAAPSIGAYASAELISRSLPARGGQVAS